MQGMYVHMHWGYNHPYAARTWSIDNWGSYLLGLKELGYDLVQIWPVIDTMPVPPTASDRAHLEKLREVIEIAHSLGMTVYVGASANTVGNEHAGKYRFEDRPYFAAEQLISPSDNMEVVNLIETRRILLEPLKEADGFWIIDSDPGGYSNSSTSEFVTLFAEHRKMLDNLRPGIKLLYWMWAGWTDEMRFGTEWSENPQACWRDALEGIISNAPEPWGILGCWQGHFKVIQDLGLTDRTMYFPYGTVEVEPSFPWTNYEPERIEKAFMQIPVEERPQGVMGNAQTHCIQLPHTYLFSHFAHGGTHGDIDLTGFAGDVFPDHSDILSRAWTAFAKEDPDAMQASLAGLRNITERDYNAKGRLSGLCFNDTQRLVDDLAMQIEVKMAILELRRRVTAGGNSLEARHGIVSSLGKWYNKHGFSDRYYGPFRNLLHPVLEKLSGQIDHGERLSESLRDFESGPKHDSFARLFETLIHI